MRPRLVALALAGLLAACGAAGERGTTPARSELVGTADVERLLVSTQKRKSPRLRVGAASCPDQMPGDAVQKVDAVVKDLQGAVVVRG